MNANNSLTPGEGPHGLRQVLLRYRVPPAPDAIEERLRATFRRRQARRRAYRWASLAAAASVVLVIGALLVRQSTRPADRGTPLQAAVVAPVPPVPASEPSVSPRHAEDRPQRRGPVARPEPAVEVIVEPNQAELLLRWARSVRENGGAVGDVDAKPRRIEMEARQTDRPTWPTAEGPSAEPRSVSLSDWQMQVVDFPPARLERVEGIENEEPAPGSGGGA